MPPSPPAHVPEAPKTWCATSGTHAFCSDFDTADGVDLWGSHNKDVTGSATLGPSERSAPNALVVHGVKVDSDAMFSSGAWFYKNVDATLPKRIVLGADVRIDGPAVRDDNNALQVLFLGVQKWDNSGLLSAGLNLRKTKSELQGVDDPNLTPMTAPDPPFGKWFRLEILATATDGGTLEMLYDGVSVAKGPAKGKLDGNLIVISIGSLTGGPIDAWTVAYDNVSLDVEQ
jgi:hypothetical protein